MFYDSRRLHFSWNGKNPKEFERNFIAADAT